MGNLMCDPWEAAHLSAVARDFCPFPDYSPSHFFNTLSSRSSGVLSQHYTRIQASLTPQQRQDFSRSLRSTFGREGKVSHGGMGIVALSLVVLFETVAREVKGEHVSDQEPIPGLFLRDPRGTYPPPVYTISRYLRLVPYIANNPTRMRDETEKFLHEFNDIAHLAQQYEDIAGLNLMFCALMAKNMEAHLKYISNKTIDLKSIEPDGKDPDVILNLNCDHKEASERFLSQLDSLGVRTKEAYENCAATREGKTVIEDIATFEWAKVVLMMVLNASGQTVNYETEDFDLKADAIAKWA